MLKLFQLLTLLSIYSGFSFGQVFEITPPNLDFGNVVIGSNGVLQATVDNPGTSELVISGIVSSDGQFTFSPNAFPDTVAAGGSQVYDVTFTPTVTGLTAGDLTFTHNATGSPTVYSVQGTGVEATFTISPASLDFGNVVLGSNSILQATVDNPGTSELVISNIVSSDGQFTFSPNAFPDTVAAGGSQVYDVTFTPTVTGLTAGDLTFTHNATGSPTVYSVQGTGVEATFTISPASLDFGNVVLGSNSILQATVDNPGTSELVISGIVSSDGQFTFSPNAFPDTVAAGGSQVYDVTFTPTVTGLTAGDLTFTHNATGSPTVYSVQGTGVEATFTISPASLDFGNVVLGSNSILQATVDNPGTSELVISNIVSSDGQFTFSPNAFPDTVAAGGSQVYDVTFTPTVTGLTAGDLTFTHNATGSPTVYSVQGTGVEATFTISPASLDFGNVVLGSNSILQATVDNPGTSELVISNIVSSDGQFTFSPNAFPDTVAAGGSQVYDVTFTPTVTGLTAGDLTFTHNATGSPTVYSVQGTGVEATFTISPASLDFGNVVLGSNSILQATVDNPGTSELVISGIVSSDGQFTFSPNAFPDTVAAGGSQVYDVTFTPTVTGLTAGDLTFTHNATGSPTVYSVQGTGVEATFTISPASLDFGNVVLGSNSILQATVDNPGTSELVISNIVSSDGQFTFSPNAFPDTVAAGGSQVYDVTFTPTVTGLTAGDLTFTHNATGSPTVYSVQGTGVEATFTISPASLDFGNVVLGSNSILQATVDNPGTSELVISGIVSSDGQFTFSPNAFPDTVAAGGSQVYDVTFTPTVTGLTAGDLTFTHNATGSPTVYSIQGTGVEATFTISPASLDFGNVVLGSNSILQATVDNPGTSELVISGIVSSDGQFTFSPNAFPDTVAAGGSQVYDVTFTPTVTGLTAGDLTFTHNATGSPTVYSVQGTGVEATFTISPASLDFGNVVLGSNSILQATVDNPGTSELVISNIVSSDGQFTFSPNAFPDTVAAGGSQVYDVTFTPTVTGLTAGDLTFTHNATGSPTVYSVQGTGVEATFTISPASLDFGNVVLGSNSILQATVDNPGTSELVISNIVSSDGQFTFSPNAFPDTVAAGGSQVYDVTFTPTVTGLTAGDLTFTHNATGSPTVYSVQGTGVEATFTISPASLDFGNVVLGSNSILQATVDNPGTSELVISGIVSSDGQFTFSPNAFPDTVAAGGSQVYDVTFTPTVTGLTAGDLTFTHNATGSPTVYSVQGTGVEATFTISPASLDFGNVVLGSNSILQATVDNPGTSELVISGIVSSDGQFTFSPNAFPDTVAAGGSQVYDVTFTPTVTGLTAGDLTFTHNATGSPTVYSVQGTGVEATFTISPASLDFGNVVLGSNSILQATVDNPGTSELVISNIVSSDGQFTFSPNAFPDTVAAGGSQVYDVTFTPTVTGLTAGDLTFTHNATGSPTVYSVQGTGVEATFTISPASLDFGNVVLGSNSILQATVDNPGTSELVISGIVSSDGQFTFSPNAFPDTVAAGGSQVYDVTFTPTVTGLTAGDLTFTHNATGSPTVYSVQGTGVEATFTISPASLDFGNVVLGSNSILQATVDNPGTSELVISGIVSSDGQFTFSPNAFPDTVAAGGSQVYDVTFTPTVTGLTAGDLTFTHNATGSPTVYSVQGTGVEATFTISPASLDFGNVVLGSNSILQATVDNPGTSELVISNIVSSDGQFTFSPNAFPDTVAAGGSQVYDVTFTPTVTGLTAGDLTFTHNATGSPTVYSVQGTGVEATFTISPASLDFGNVVLGSNSILQATVDNPGTSELVISGIVSSDGQFTFSPNAFPDTVAAGGSQVYDVTFTPTVTGLTAGDLTFTHNATGSPTVYSVQGTGVEATFTISPASLDFGNVVLGSNSILQATVDNPGTSELVISGIVSSDGQFTFSPNAFPDTVAAGGSQVYDVTFTPTVTGLTAGDLTFTHNATGSPTVYSVQGTGVEATFTISPASLDFGNVVLGSNSILQATVDNPGTSELVISNIVSSDGQFTFSPNAFPDTVAAGGSQVYDVTFTPTVTGLTAGDLTFTHNATGSPTVYSVQGTGLDVFEVDTYTINLINVITGTTRDTSVTVTNNSANPLVLTSSSTGSSNWNVLPDTAIVLAGGSFIFAVTFTAPVLPGTYNGSLAFQADTLVSNPVSLSAIVVSDAGIVFEQDSVYRLEDNSYTDIMQLKSLTDSLHALQFRLQVNKEPDDNVILTFENIQKGTDISDSSWILQYNVIRGPITPNGASVDEVFVLLYNLNQGVGLPPGSYNDLFMVNYRVADLPALQDSVKSTFKITHVEGSKFDGSLVDVTPSKDLLTVIARNRVSWYGDVNSDGYLDILDLIMVIDHIVSIDSLEGTAFLRGDIAPWPAGELSPSPDGFVNVRELSLIQNIILTGVYPNGTPIGDQNSILPKSASEGNATVTFYVSENGIKAYLNSTVGIRGAQVEFANVSDDPGNMIIKTDLGQGFFHYVDTDEILRTLLYDPLGEKFIEPGEHLMAEMPFAISNPDELTLDNLILVDVTREKLPNIQVELIYGNNGVIPEEYALMQNYPNPFNPGTTIEFSLPEDVNNVQLSIYNMLGEKVTELVNTALPAGSHQYQWNARNVATGMYIYELRTEKFISVKKMILIK